MGVCVEGVAAAAAVAVGVGAGAGAEGVVVMEEGSGGMQVDERRSCAYFRGELVHQPTVASGDSDEAKQDLVTVDEKGRQRIRCIKEDSCFSYWNYTINPDTNTSVITWLARGE
ncbi:hypothetical protein Pcinc_043677 [Petrolisthes cinctipes]|uniref:Uncharacterized protein n=1 Tax=Petrolisthes cinctipes TaxID=88211 RepID=A0AAE1BFJ2_PETCI|nr:hypothetical protein Pcinc_043677 [Petrolisthes cinctipes]